MTDHIWIGGAPAVSQVVTVTIPDEVSAGMVIRATIGLKTLPYTVPTGATATSVAAAFVALWNASTVPHFAEITAAAGSVAGTFTLTADEEGKPFVVAFSMTGGTNEIQVVTIGGSPTGGTFTLAYGGEVTSGIAYNAAASTVETALEGLTGIGASNVSVSGSNGGPYTIEFIGALAGENVAEIGANGDNLTVAAETQVVDLGGATGGTFTIQYGESGTPSSNLAYNISAANLKTAIEALSGIAVDDVGVAGSDGGPFTLTFQGAFTGVNADSFVVNGANLTGGLMDAVTIAEQTAGGGGGNEVWTIWEEAGTPGGIHLIGDTNVSGGTFDLSITLTPSGGGSAVSLIDMTSIPYDVTIDELQDLIDTNIASEDLSATGNTIRVTGAAAGEQLTSGVSWNLNILSVVGNYTVASVLGTGSLTGGAFTKASIGSTIDAGDGFDSLVTWSITINGESSGSIQNFATAATVQAAIEGISSVGSGNVAVEYLDTNLDGVQHGIRITFQGDLANQATGFSISATASGFTLNEVKNWAGAAGTAEVQRISISGSPGSGEFSIFYGTGVSQAIAYNQTASELEDILEAVSTIGVGNVTCSGGPFPDSFIDVTFAGGLTGSDLDLMVENQGSVETTQEGGTAPTITVTTTQAPISQTTTTAGSGPNDWSVAANWDTNTVPTSSDNVFIVDGDNILYGLDQSAVTLGRLEIGNKEVEIGLPRRNVDTIEYRDIALKIGAATIVTGLGDGNGSDRIQIDFGGTDPAITVHASGRGTDEPAVQFTSTNATNTATLEILGGEVGVAVYPNQEAHFASIVQRSGDLTIGSDVTLLGLERTGGSISIDEATIDGTISL